MGHLAPNNRFTSREVMIQGNSLALSERKMWAFCWCSACLNKVLEIKEAMITFNRDSHIAGIPMSMDKDC